jgi:ribokinase
MPRPFVILGSANVDFIMRVPRLPARGETVTEGVFLQTYGGKGANQAVAAARAGARAAFIGCVGRDRYGDEAAANFDRDGLDISGLKRSATQPTGSALVMIDGQGMNYLTVAPGANHDLLPADVEALRAVIASAGLILLQMEVPPATNLAAAAIARAAGSPVMLNYAPAHLSSPELLRATDILIVNENEACALTSIAITDTHSALRAAQALSATGPRRVVVTLGAQGWVALDGDATLASPAFPVTAVDTTAAGDTFCGALGTALLEGRDFATALRFASAASAVSVTRLGAQPSIPARAEIDAFLADHSTPEHDSI